MMMVSTLITALADVSPIAQVHREDLTHLQSTLDIISNLVEGTTSNDVTGTNILLWGDPGTGKTELARYVAQSLGLRCFEVKTIDKNGEPMTEVERVSSYKFAQSLLIESADAMIIFDEAENILDPSEQIARMVSKAYTNKSLETNIRPAIWISNRIDDADPAYLRRFDYVC